MKYFIVLNNLKSMKICFNSNENEIKDVLKIINNDNNKLEELELNEGYFNILLNCEKIYKNIKNIKIKFLYLKQLDLNLLSKKFPNLNFLKIENNGLNLIEIKDNNIKFKNLEKIKFHFVNLRKIKNINFNGKLKQIKILFSKTNINLIYNIIKANKNIEDLNIDLNLYEKIGFKEYKYLNFNGNDSLIKLKKNKKKNIIIYVNDFMQNEKKLNNIFNKVKIKFNKNLNEKIFFDKNTQIKKLIFEQENNNFNVNLCQNFKNLFNFHSLIYLIFTNVKLDFNSKQIFYNNIENLVNLKKINFQNFNINYKIFFQKLANIVFIQKIKIRNCNINDDDFKIFCENLKIIKYIEKLDFYMNKLSKYSLNLLYENRNYLYFLNYLNLRLNEPYLNQSYQFIEKYFSLNIEQFLD